MLPLIMLHFKFENFTHKKAKKGKTNFKNTTYKTRSGVF